MNTGLNLLDVIFLILIFLSILLGTFKGFIRELFSLAFFIIAVVLSFLFYDEIGSIFNNHFENRDVSNFMGFILIFVVVLIVGTLVTYFIKKTILIEPLKSIDRILGGVFGLFRGILISAVLVFGLVLFPVKEDVVKRSKLSPYVLKAIEVFYNFLPEKIKKKLKLVNYNGRQKNNRTS